MRRADTILALGATAADLLSRIRTIEGEMAAGSGRPLPVAGFAGFRRG